VRSPANGRGNTSTSLKGGEKLRRIGLRPSEIWNNGLEALVEAGDPEAVDVYLSEQDAHRALEDCLRDEPDLRGLLYIAAVELSAENSRN
jgi:hypothetical protein